MANTQYVQANRLRVEIKQSQKKVLLIGATVFGLFGCATLIAFLVSPPMVLFPAGGALLTLFVTIIVLSTLRSDVIEAGAHGEDVALSTLSRLPDSYYLINQVKVPNQEAKTGSTEVDLIAIGPNGVFVIEVKNNNGRVVGSEEDKEWIVHKVGRRGGQYTSQMGNPVRQLKKQIWVLKNYLNQNGLNPWLTGMVLLTNPECRLELLGEPSVPIFQNDEIIKYIQETQAKHKLSNLDKIVSCLAKTRTEDRRA